jgi:hypothetical protein
MRRRGAEDHVPRYFFDIVENSVEELQDDTGVELVSVEMAKVEGAIALARMMAEAISGPSDNIMHIVVRDEARRPLARVVLSLTMKDSE